MEDVENHPLGGTEVDNFAIGVVKGSVFCSGTLYVCARCDSLPINIYMLDRKIFYTNVGEAN